MLMNAPNFDPRHLLWRTKGFNWDYNVVAVPTRPEGPWGTVLNGIFPGSTPAATLAQGDLAAPDGSNRPFVAAALEDPNARDEAGRPVWHYFVWLPDTEALTGLSLADALPGDWPVQILQRLRVAHTAAMDSPNSPPDLSSHLAREIAPASLHTAPSAPHTHVPPDRLKKATPTSPSPAPRRLSNTSLLILALSACALAAVLSTCSR